MTLVSRYFPLDSIHANADASARAAAETALQAFQPRDGFLNPNLDSFEKIVTEEYLHRFKNSPLKRAKQAGLLRNLLYAKQNQ